MNNYNFATLNDEEFEEICKDLLREELGLDFRTYKKGRDKGIDLSCINGENKIIGQVKHYPKSKYSDLKSTLKKELEKVREEKFEKYILITSLDLTVNQIQEIIILMNGIIKNEDDIYDLKKINTILQKKENEWIEKKYYKLWLSSTTVLNRIINNAQENNIEYYIDEIEKKLKLYVVTENFNKALEILNKTNMLLIHGEPGAGKTVLAEMLIYRYLDKGYKLKFISGNKIKELEEIMSNSKEEKEVIFIDDFLGSNFLEMFTQTSENKLVFFLKKYLNKECKKVILTTRTIIYNKAIQQSEILNRFSIEFEKYKLEVTSYNMIDKAKILYNHLYFNEIPKKYKKKIKDEMLYLKIVKHRNYTPRIIEFFTNVRRVSQMDPAMYINFIFKNLNNPSEIWKNEFENKISDEERFLICTLFTFEIQIDEDILRNAFEDRYNYEIMNNNFTRIQNTFDKSLESLSKGFIRITRGMNNKNIMISFINPSINDFLINYLKNNIDEIKRIVSSVRYIEQLEIFKANSVIRYGTNANNEVKKLIKNRGIDNFKNIETYKVDKNIYILELIILLYNNDSTMKEFIKDILYNFIKEKTIGNKQNLNLLIDLLENKNIGLSDIEDLYKKEGIVKKGEEIILNKIQYIETFVKYTKMIKSMISYEDVLALFNKEYLAHTIDRLSEQAINDFCNEISFIDECGFENENNELYFDYNEAENLLECNFHLYKENIFFDYKEELSYFLLYERMKNSMETLFDLYYKENILEAMEEIWNEIHKANITNKVNKVYQEYKGKSSSDRYNYKQYESEEEQIINMFNRL